MYFYGSDGTSPPFLAQQFTFHSLFLFLKGSKLVQLGMGGWPWRFDTEVREQRCMISCFLWPRETPPASSHTKSALVRWLSVAPAPPGRRTATGLHKWCFNDVDKGLFSAIISQCYSLTLVTF